MPLLATGLTLLLPPTQLACATPLFVFKLVLEGWLQSSVLGVAESPVKCPSGGTWGPEDQKTRGEGRKSLLRQRAPEAELVSPRDTQGAVGPCQGRLNLREAILGRETGHSLPLCPHPTPQGTRTSICFCPQEGGPRPEAQQPLPWTGLGKSPAVCPELAAGHAWHRPSVPT